MPSCFSPVRINKPQLGLYYEHNLFYFFIQFFMKKPPLDVNYLKIFFRSKVIFSPPTNLALKDNLKVQLHLCIKSYMFSPTPSRPYRKNQTSDASRTPYTMSSFPLDWTVFTIHFPPNACAPVCRRDYKPCW